MTKVGEYIVDYSVEITAEKLKKNERNTKTGDTKMANGNPRRIAGIARKDWLLEVLRFKYTDHLFTRRVKNYLSLIAWALIAQLFVDLFVWIKLWGMALPEELLWVGPLGAAFALVILKIDQGIVTADTSADEGKWKPLAWRLGFIVFLSFVTAVSFELAVFQRDIERRMDQKENLAVTALKDAEITKLDSKYQKLTQQARTDGAEELSAAQGTGQQDVEAYKDRRLQERESIVARYAADKQGIHDQIAAGDQRIADETKGKFSGNTGIGSMVRALQQEKEKFMIDLAGIRQNEATELSAFDQTTASTIASLEGKRDSDTTTAQTLSKTKLKSLQQEWDDKVMKIREMDREQFATIYGGDWKQTRGFSNRYKILIGELAEEEPAVKMMIWGLRMLMMALGLAILILKLSAPREVTNYYSYRLQTASGDQDSIQHGEAEGHTDPEHRKALGWSSEIQQVRAKLHEARQAVAQAWRTWWTQSRDVCQPNERTGLCRSREDVATQLRLNWDVTLMTKLDELGTAEEEVKQNGQAVPRWDNSLYTCPDPRNLEDPWDLNDTELRGLNWEDPSERIRDAQEASEALPALYRQLIDNMAQMDRMTRGRIRTTPMTPELILQDQRFDFYYTKMRKLIDDVEENERKILQTGRHLTERPRSLKEMDRIRECWKTERRKLKEWGWGQEVPNTPASTPTPETTNDDEVTDNDLVDTPLTDDKDNDTADSDAAGDVIPPPTSDTSDPGDTPPADDNA